MIIDVDSDCLAIFTAILFLATINGIDKFISIKVFLAIEAISSWGAIKKNRIHIKAPLIK